MKVQDPKVEFQLNAPMKIINEMSEKFELEISLKCFNSKFLDKKLLGLKMIVDVLRRAR